jgi:hypothetical protein
VDDMLAERGHSISYETVCCWVNKFGIWMKMVVRIKGQRTFNPFVRGAGDARVDCADDIADVRTELAGLHFLGMQAC